MINIYEHRSYGGQDIEVVVYVAKDQKEARAFIGKTANDLNYGLVRHWVYGRGTSDAHYLYDCGPVTYYTKESIEEEGHEIDG